MIRFFDGFTVMPALRMLALAAILAGHASVGLAQGDPKTLPPAPVATATMNVWPGTAPGEKGNLPPESLQPETPARHVDRLQNVSIPTITFYDAPADRKTGTTVVVCPGGGYHILAMDLEGTEICQWLNSLGVSAVLLKYRVPGRTGQPNWLAPLQDAQRAVRLVRAHAAEWKIDPNRIGILGFSAGGHLAAMTSTNYKESKYDKLDAGDELSSRPDFTVLVYPAYLVEKDQLSPLTVVDKDTPPAFLVHAFDDPVTCESSLLYALALKKAKVSCELHLYQSGGHGYGLRPDAGTVATWPDRCGDWLRGRKLIPANP